MKESRFTFFRQSGWMLIAAVGGGVFMSLVQAAAQQMAKQPNGEYHWMAGNFLKYGTAESSFGSKNPGDLPVDAHELIALCAPRFTFISYGVPEKGDANWLDQQGSYMATVAAGPVFRLLGAKDIGEKEDYRTAKMPPVNTGLLDGELAWRQHDGGHEDRSNMKYFIEWANKMIARHPK